MTALIAVIFFSEKNVKIVRITKQSNKESPLINLGYILLYYPNSYFSRMRDFGFAFHNFFDIDFDYDVLNL